MCLGIDYQLWRSGARKCAQGPRRSKVRTSFVIGAALLALAVTPAIPARAADPEFTLSIRDHRFDPRELQVPAGVKIRLIVKNLDATPEEFESNELHREKV